GREGRRALRWFDSEWRRFRRFDSERGRQDRRRRDGGRDRWRWRHGRRKYRWREYRRQSARWRNRWRCDRREGMRLRAANSTPSTARGARPRGGYVIFAVLIVVVVLSLVAYRFSESM